MLHSYINERMVQNLRLNVHSCKKDFTMAQRIPIPKAMVVMNLTHDLKNQVYNATYLNVLQELCFDIRLDQDFLCQHQRSLFKYSRHLLELIVDSARQCCTLAQESHTFFQIYY